MQKNAAERCCFRRIKGNITPQKMLFILPRFKVKRCRKNLFSCLNWAVQSLPAGMAGTTFHRSGGQVPYKFMDIKSSRKGSKLAALSRFSFAVFLSEHTAAPEITASPPMIIKAFRLWSVAFRLLSDFSTRLNHRFFCPWNHNLQLDAVDFFPDRRHASILL